MAEGILKNTTFQAENRMTFRADPDVLRYFIDHPDFAAAVSRGLGHDTFRVQWEDGRYRVFHGYARGTFWTVERKAGRAVYLARGVYDHPAFRWIGILLRARSYVIESFERASSPGAEAGSHDLQLSIRAYLFVENPVLGKIFGWIAPLIRRAFESKLTRAYRIAPELSQMAFEGGSAFLEKVRKIEDLDPSLLRKFDLLVRKRTARQYSERPPWSAGLKAGCRPGP